MDIQLADCFIKDVDMIEYHTFEATPIDSKGFRHGLAVYGSTPLDAYTAMCRIYGYTVMRDDEHKLLLS